MACECIRIEFRLRDELTSTVVELDIAGTYNSENYYTWTYLSVDYYLYYNPSGGGQWEVTYGGLGSPAFPVATSWKDSEPPCPPLGSMPVWTQMGAIFDEFTTADCIPIILNCGIEDRIFREYIAIKLPQSFTEQDRGIKDCCCEQLVLGSSAESWKNDLTSFWIKLASDADTAEFQILDCDANVLGTFEINTFPNEINAFYATCDWNEILTTYGQGNYTLAIEYSISGLSGTLLWGDYKLLPYSIHNALKTARVRAIFNGKQTIDGIDFTNSNVESTHRFYGYLGNRQPNMAIDNIIYDNREMKRVIRENLNDYEIITDPENECILRPLLELFFISENELFISDYNAHNHSYRYLDLPVIVSESPEVEYKDFSRKAVLKCKVADKFKSQRTFY
jgi:hypothetical protein